MSLSNAPGEWDLEERGEGNFWLIHRELNIESGPYVINGPEDIPNIPHNVRMILATHIRATPTIEDLEREDRKQ